MGRPNVFGPSVLIMMTLMSCTAFAELITHSSDDSQSLERELKVFLDEGAQNSSDPNVLLKLSSLYQDLGDLYTEVKQRRAAYEEGARLARRVLDLQEVNAEAHYLYAANLGSAVQLKGMMASAFTVRDLKAHVSRALELRNNHAPSLHMMGMMLEELPWILGGDPSGALDYLKRAVATDPQDMHARLDLAKAYIKRHDPEAARRELRVILATDHLGTASRYHSEAKQLLASLEAHKGSSGRP